MAGRVYVVRATHGERVVGISVTQDNPTRFRVERDGRLLLQFAGARDCEYIIQQLTTPRFSAAYDTDANTWTIWSKREQRERKVTAQPDRDSAWMTVDPEGQFLVQSE